MTGYDALVKYGHSAAKAAEICLDSKRGEPLARAWIKTVLDIVKEREKAEADRFRAADTRPAP